MSFILDALRKSEAERQRQTGPGLVDAAYRPPARRRRLWIPLLAVILIANLAVMGTLLLRQGTNSQPEDASTESVTAVEATVLAERTHSEAPISPAEDEDALWEEMANRPALEPAADAMTDGGAGHEAPSIAAGSTEVRRDEPAARTTPDSAAEARPAEIVQDGLPTFEALTAEGQLRLPSLHLDMHVFTPHAGGRFVFINTDKYTEGSRLAEGPQIEEITAEGVILNHEGQRFLLSR